MLHKMELSDHGTDVIISDLSYPVGYGTLFFSLDCNNCWRFLFPLKGSKPEQQMMYSGSKNFFVRGIGATKVIMFFPVVIIIFHKWNNLGCQENSNPKISDLRPWNLRPQNVLVHAE